MLTTCISVHVYHKMLIMVCTRIINRLCEWQVIDDYIILSAILKNVKCEKTALTYFDTLQYIHNTQWETSTVLWYWKDSFIHLMSTNKLFYILLFLHPFKCQMMSDVFVFLKFEVFWEMNKLIKFSKKKKCRFVQSYTINVSHQAQYNDNVIIKLNKQ